jgi:hypothetical protein
MKLFLVSLVAACALMAAMATSAVASTDSHFPEINPVGGPTACTAIAGGGALGTGSTCSPTPVRAARKEGDAPH